MSASQDKKRRQTERMEGTDKRTLAEREAAQKAKRSAHAGASSAR